MARIKNSGVFLELSNIADDLRSVSIIYKTDVRITGLIWFDFTKIYII